MEKRFFTWALAAALCVGGALTSCSDDDTTPDGGNGNGGTTTPGTSKYVIAAKADEGTYLVTSESLDEGTVTYWATVPKPSVRPIGYSTANNTSSGCNTMTETQEPELLTP